MQSPALAFAGLLLLAVAITALPHESEDQWEEREENLPAWHETLIEAKGGSGCGEPDDNPPAVDACPTTGTIPAKNAGSTNSPTKFPWDKACTEGDIKRYVDGTNGKDYKTWGSTEEKPYKTIQFAVDQNTGTCATIYIKAGTYNNKGYKGKGYSKGNNLNNSNKIVNMDSVTKLIIRNYGGADGTGEGGDKVLLKFDGPGGFVGGSASDISKRVEDVDIYGLEIEGPNQEITYEMAIGDRLTGSKYFSGRGIAFWKALRVHIHHMLVHDTPAAGLRCDNSDYVVVEDSEVYRTTWWANSAESAIVLGQSVNVDDCAGIKMMLRRNKVYMNMNRIPYYNKSYKWSYAPIGSYDCSESQYNCEDENTNGCGDQKDDGTTACTCPWQCRYGKLSQDYVIDGQGVYVTRNSETYRIGKMEMSDNEAYLNGINGLVFHRTFRGFVKSNVLYDNGQVPKTSETDETVATTPWKKALTKTRQPYAGLVLNNADQVKVYNNKVRARYDSDYAFTMEVDDGCSFAIAAGGNNKDCRGKVDDNIDPYHSDATDDQCKAWLPDEPVSCEDDADCHYTAGASSR